MLKDLKKDDKKKKIFFILSLILLITICIMILSYVNNKNRNINYNLLMKVAKKRKNIYILNCEEKSTNTSNTESEVECTLEMDLLKREKMIKTDVDGVLEYFVLDYKDNKNITINTVKKHRFLQLEAEKYFELTRNKNRIVIENKDNRNAKELYYEDAGNGEVYYQNRDFFQNSRVCKDSPLDFSLVLNLTVKHNPNKIIKIDNFGTIYTYSCYYDFQGKKKECNNSKFTGLTSKVELLKNNNANNSKDMDSPPSLPKAYCEEIEFNTNLYTSLFYLMGGTPEFEECHNILLDEKTIYNQREAFGVNSLKNNSKEEKAKLLFGLLAKTYGRRNGISYDSLSEEIKESLRNKKSIYDRNIQAGFYTYPYEVVNKYYHTFFGEDIERKNSSIFCNSVYYDKSSDSFIIIDANTCSKQHEVYFYINNIELKDNSAIIMVNVGNSQGSNAVYNDFTSDKIVLNNLNVNTFKMTAENAKQFREYKYTFKKDENGNYYFDSFK